MVGIRQRALVPTIEQDYSLVSVAGISTDDH